MPDGSRDAAFEVLKKCQGTSFSNEALELACRRFGLDRRDASLAYRLSLGVLQNTAILDHYLSPFLNNPEKMDSDVRWLLRLGAYQILFNDRIPDHAAVSETVALCKRQRKTSASGLVNAVLRKLAVSKNALPEIPFEDPAAYLSIKYSHPLWICERFIADFGYNAAEEFLKYDNSIPPMTLQVNTLKTDSESFARMLDDAAISYCRCEASENHDENAFLVNGVPARTVPGYDEGLFYVQDRAARFAVSMLNLKPGMRVIDVCAAPGGKSVAAAIVMGNTGEIVSCDIRDKKTALIRQSAERLGIAVIKERVLDAREFVQDYCEGFDAVIADVPCSGFGVMAKKPEIRFKSVEETARLPEIQRDILNNVSRYVKPGGTLLYSTCTVFSEENGDVVSAFLDSSKGFSLAAERLFLPGKDGTDGFYAACLKKEGIQ